MFTRLQHFQNFPTQGTHSFKSFLFCITTSQKRVIGLCCRQATTTLILPPFFKKRCTSLLYIISVVLSTIELPDARSGWDSNPQLSVTLPLSYPGVFSREEESNLWPTDLAGISGWNNSIQIVTTSALLCFFETWTWFVFNWAITRLAVKQAFVPIR